MLQISEATGNTLTVELSGFPVNAIAEVWAEADDVLSLANFFIELGRLQSPWQGTRSWSSLEGELVLSVSCSSLGVIGFNILLCGLLGSPEEWRVKVGIESEFGQLEQLAKEAEELRNV